MATCGAIKPLKKRSESRALSVAWKKQSERGRSQNMGGKLKKRLVNSPLFRPAQDQKEAGNLKKVDQGHTTEKNAE